MSTLERKPNNVDNKIIMECFLNKNFKEIFNTVNKLPYINGDLQLETDDNDNNNIKASLFWLAVLMNDTLLMSTLLDRGNCNVNALGTYNSRDFFKATPLYVACALGYDYMDAIALLLDYSADVNIADEDGYTPLIINTFSLSNSLNAITITNYLLLHGADINFKDIDGNTALHYALAYGRSSEHARYLIRRGADPLHIKNKASNLKRHDVFRAYRSSTTRRKI